MPRVHSIAVRYGGDSNLLPGTVGTLFGFGPLILSRTTQELPVTCVQPANARSLCGKSLNWIEAVGG